MRILAISDLHTDFKHNKQLILELQEKLYQNDILIVAGDIAHQLALIKETLSLLRSKFRQVFFVPGNHDLWVQNKKFDSIEKLMMLLKLCDSLDIQIRPSKINYLWIVPLFSWYNAEFGDQFQLDTSELEGWMDFYLCKWPPGIEPIDKYFAQLNQPHLKAYDGPVISFSHFLPRLDLLPPPSRLRFKALCKVAGSRRLEAQIRQLNSEVHVFGHSHINWDEVIDGTRYIQNALSLPQRWAHSRFPIKVIWDFSQNPQIVGLKRGTY